MKDSGFVAPFSVLVVKWVFPFLFLFFFLVLDCCGFYIFRIMIFVTPQNFSLYHLLYLFLL